MKKDLQKDTLKSLNSDDNIYIYFLDMFKIYNLI